MSEERKYLVTFSLSAEERREFLEDVKAAVKLEMRSTLVRIEQLERAKQASYEEDRKHSKEIKAVNAGVREVDATIRQTKDNIKADEQFTYQSLGVMLGNMATSVDQLKGAVIGRLDNVELEMKEIKAASLVKVTDAKGGVSIIPAAPATALAVQQQGTQLTAIATAQDQNDKNTLATKKKTTATIIISALGFATAAAHVIIQLVGK